MKYIDFAKSVLKEHSYRFTGPRKLVLQTLASTKKSLNAYEIAAEIEKIGDKVDVSTVYRILEVLRELNLVHFNSQRQRYSACKDYDCGIDQHCHHEFVCDSCEMVVEIHIDDSSWLQSLKKINKNLQINNHHFELSGLCAACK